MNAREAIEKVIAELTDKCEAVENEESTTSRRSGRQASMECMFLGGSAEALKWSIAKLRAVLAEDSIFGDEQPKGEGPR